MTPAQLEQAAKRAAEGVARNTGVPAQLAHAPVLWALQDAQAEADYQAAERLMRIYWRALAGAVVLGATWWAWP